MKEIVHVFISSEAKMKVKEMAVKENRSFSYMVDALLKKQLKIAS